jgi:N-succinyldiaminopimelate aminotransferase
VVISRKLQPFGTTIFSEMTRLAIEHQAINLSQGFPDFEGPQEIVEAAVTALRSGSNQYARSMGAPSLVDAIAGHQKRFYDLDFDPTSEVVVFSGATEGIASSMLGLLDPGDEVVLFEPFYDSYPACIAMAGAIPRYVTLRFPDFALDEGELARAFGSKTRLIVLNTPHNPTGKVFTRKELELIAALAKQHDALVLTDEVYEHLIYDVEHVPIATLPGMRERTLTISSIGKTYSFTGWKIGWATGPAPLVKAAQAAHQFVTFATATPLQQAAAFALTEHAEPYYQALVKEYSVRRELLLEMLRARGLDVSIPRGAYYVLADFTRVFSGSDVDFARHLVTEIGVAAIPPSCFYASNPEEGRRLIRFAFCKRIETLEAARRKLASLTPRS